MITAFFIGLTLVSTIHAHPGVHRITGHYVTRIHRVTGIKVTRGEGDGEVTVPEPVVTDEGASFSGNIGVDRRRVCGRGTIDQTATAVRETVNAGVEGMADALSGLTENGNLGVIGDAVNSAGHVARDLITNGVEGVDFAIQDAACGLGNIANDIAYGLNTGDVLGAVGDAGQEFFGGVANVAEDLISQAGEGIKAAANDFLGFFGLGK